MIPIHILLAEDNRVDAHFVETLLRQAKLLSATMDTVGWLSSALTMLGAKRYDLVLLDLGLPDSSGIDTATAVIREAPNVPIIVLSGREDLDTAQVAIRAGAQSFIAKSSDLTPEYLERVILYALERSRIERKTKDLLLESHARLSGQDELAVDGHVLEPHLRRIEEAVGVLETYLARNSPQQYERAREILDQEGFYLACREMRSLLLLRRDRKSGLGISQAMQALKQKSKSDPPIATQAAARADIADAMLDWTQVWSADDD